MYKQSLLSVLLIAVSTTLFSQQSYRVTYKHSIQFDTTKYLTSDYGLEAVLTGNEVASNYNYLKVSPDTFLKQQNNAINPEDFFRQKKSGVYETITGIRPDSNGTMAYWSKKTDSIYVRDKMTMQYVTTSEKRPVIKWIINNETKQIKSYTCTKATAYFRGRNYVAWFTKDVNIIDGPWKFKGLPGLIIEIADDNLQVRITAEKVELIPSLPVPVFVNEGQKLTMEEYFQFQNKEAKEIHKKMMAYMQPPATATGGVKPIRIDKGNMITNSYGIEKRMN